MPGEPTTFAEAAGMKVARMLVMPVLALLASALFIPAAAQTYGVPTPTPGQEDSGQLAGRRFNVHTADGDGAALYYGNGSLDGSRDVTRAVIIVHGVLRNADYYFQTGQIVLEKARAAHTLLIAPQSSNPRVLHERNPRGTAQDYEYVRGVAHDNRKMFTSHCGLGVIFGGSVRECAGHGKV